MTHPILVAVLAACMFPGIFLVFIPMVPALWYMFAVSLVFGILDHFVHLTWGNIGVLFLFVLLSILVDTFSGLLGARYGGASKKSIGWGFVGILVGTVALPPFGGLIGLFLGVFVSEYMEKKGNTALRAATSSLLGTLTGMCINCLLAICFFSLFLIFSLH